MKNPHPNYTAAELRAYHEGYEACDARPRYFPSNPHRDAECREAWFEGADDAGRLKVYTNGVYSGERS